MRRSLLCFVLSTCALALFIAPDLAAQQKAWGTVKGKVVWGGPNVPAQKAIVQPAGVVGCPANIMDEDLVINPTNKGIKWVFVWLAPPNGPPAGAVVPVHPALLPMKPNVEIDQPQCMFIPRSVAMRQGQDFLVKNTSAIVHNIKWTGDPDLNPGGSVVIPAKGSFTLKGLMAQKLPLVLECNIHPWMKARLGVFSHPYFAVTNADGEFVLENAPVGNYRIFIYLESQGWLGGAAGRKGAPINIKAGANNLPDSVVK